MKKSELDALNAKVDFLTGEVTKLTSKLKSVEDFKEDVSLFTKDAFREVVDFMSEVDFHFRSKDFLSMIKKILRNINNISKMLDQLQSINEFIDDIRPLSKEIFKDITDKIYILEEKGILESFKRSFSIINELSENFDPDDVTHFGQAMVIMLNIAKKVANPDNLKKIERIVDKIDKYEYEKDKKISIFKVFKKAKDPTVLKGMDYLLDWAKIASGEYTRTQKNK